jgi:6-phosphogluconolactonase
MNRPANLDVRSNCRRLLVLLLPAFFVMLLQITSPRPVVAQSADVWFGTKQSGDDGMDIGVYHALLNVENGELSLPRLAIELDSPGFLAANPNPALNQSVLYTTTKIDGQHVIASLKVTADKSLKVMNSISTGAKAGGACHVTVDAAGRIAVSSQYQSGTVSVFALAEDGSIDERTQLIKHTGGSGVVDNRQNRPHAHYCGFDNDNRYAFVCDLGLDRVKVYRIDHQQRKLIEHGEAVCPPGGGPRHMKFHPGGKHAFVLNELAMSLSVFDYDSSAGMMTLKQTIKTIPDSSRDHEVFNSGSEILVHPSGRFVYSANRGNDTVSVFEFDEATGQMKRIQIEPVRGSWPRNINLSAGGNFLLAAGCDSNSVAPFKIDADTGRLQYLRGSRFVPHPICVLFTDGEQQ